MAVAVTCWGWEIKKSVKIVAIIGIIVSSLTFLSVYYIPLSIPQLAAFILIFIGLRQNRSSYLLTAQVIFGFTILLNMAVAFCTLILAVAWDYGYGSYKTILLFILSFTIIFLIVLSIFTVIIVQRLRNLLIFEYLEANLPPEEPRPRINFIGRAFPNIYSTDPNPSDSSQNDYSNPAHVSMPSLDYINVSSAAPQ